jgi:hypothetical protein
MPFVERDRTGQVRAVYACQQAGKELEEVTEEDAARAVAALTPPPTYRILRAQAYRDELGKEQGDFIRTLGDVIDVLLDQVEATRVHAGASRTAEFNTLLTKVAGIKARHPKPAD